MNCWAEGPADPAQFLYRETVRAHRHFWTCIRTAVEYGSRRTPLCAPRSHRRHSGAKDKWIMRFGQYYSRPPAKLGVWQKKEGGYFVRVWPTSRHTERARQSIRAGMRGPLRRNVPPINGLPQRGELEMLQRAFGVTDGKHDPGAHLEFTHSKAKRAIRLGPSGRSGPPGSRRRL